jgi:hypothetical protein
MVCLIAPMRSCLLVHEAKHYEAKHLGSRTRLTTVRGVGALSSCCPRSWFFFHGARTVINITGRLTVAVPSVPEFRCLQRLPSIGCLHIIAAELRTTPIEQLPRLRQPLDSTNITSTTRVPRTFLSLNAWSFRRCDASFHSVRPRHRGCRCRALCLY